MINFVLILLCIAAGVALRHFQIAPPEAHKGINVWLIYIALPAVALKYIPHIQWNPELLFPLFSPFIIWAGAFIYIYFYSKKKLLHTATQASLTLSSGLCNTSFVGFPLITAWFGEHYLNIAIICDQATFFLLSTVGLLQAMFSSRVHGGVNPRAILKRLVTFPPLLASVTALLLPKGDYLEATQPLFVALAATVSPLALFSVGLQLRFSGWRQELPLLSIGLIYKLLLGPALVLLVAMALGLHSDYAKIGIFEAAMPTLISASLVVEQYQLNTKLTNLMIGISILLSLFTTAIWHSIIEHFI